MGFIIFFKTTLMLHLQGTSCVITDFNNIVQECDTGTLSKKKKKKFSTCTCFCVRFLVFTVFCAAIHKHLRGLTCTLKY